MYFHFVLVNIYWVSPLPPAVCYIKQLLDLLLRSLAIQENILGLAFFVHLGNVPRWELECPLRTTPFGLAKCVRNVLLVTKHRLLLILHLRAGVTGSQNLVTLHHNSCHGSERVPPVRIRIQNRV
jgi:hypothetical protein